MPIYEFACGRCRKIYQFFFRSADGRARPSCPKCGKKRLPRRMSGFAVKKRDGGDASPDPLEGMDPARVERAMAKMERHMDKIDENNPREMGQFMRHLMKETGMDMEPELETAIKRLEAGEDPERIEEEMGDILGGDGGSGDGSGGEYGYDDNLYEV